MDPQGLGRMALEVQAGCLEEDVGLMGSDQRREGGRESPGRREGSLSTKGHEGNSDTSPRGRQPGEQGVTGLRRVMKVRGKMERELTGP